MTQTSIGHVDAVFPDRPEAKPLSHVQHVRDRLQAGMDQHGLDAVIAYSPENIYYTSGHPSFWAYQSSESGMPITAMLRDPALGRILVCDVFEAMSVTPNDDLTILTTPSWVDIQNPLNYEGVNLSTERPTTASKESAMLLLVEELKGRLSRGARIGVDERSCNYGAWQALAASLTGMTLVPASQLFSEARAIKSEWEIEQLTIADSITQTAISSTVNNVLRPGVTEAEITRYLRREFLADHRCTDVRFCLTPCGNTFTMALMPRDSALRDGEVMKFDCGAEVNGYGADIARTFNIGAVPPHTASAYDALHAGFETMIAGAIPGRPMADLFHEVMDSVRRNGLPDFSRGHLGHGVGLEKMVEEWPFVGPSSTSIFEPGMVLSLEVPYYGYGVGALNIENTVVVREAGVQNLTQLPTELIVC